MLDALVFSKPSVSRLVLKTQLAQLLMGGGGKKRFPCYLLSVDLLLAVGGFRRFHEPPLDLQIHGRGSALERARHFYVLSLLYRHVGGHIREATCR